MNETYNTPESCHSCGTAAMAGDRFCMKCGASLKPLYDGKITKVWKPHNPWKGIGHQPPFVLAEDRPEIEAFNSAHGHNDDRRINLYHTPVPREGPITAPLILLQLNPSFDKAKPYGHQSQQTTLLELESIKDESYPHIGVTTYDSWWIPRLRQLMNESRIGPDKLSRNICSIDFFPYRSIKFCHGAIRLPSQNYTFALVRERLASGAIIIVMRGYRLWVSEITELAAQINRTVFRTNSAQSSYITSRNLPDGVFDSICARLRSS